MKGFEKLEKKPPEEIIEWALKTFGDKVAQVTGFGAEGMVITDIYVKVCRKLRCEPKIFTIDTGRLPQETYDLMERTREKYGVSITIYFPDKKSVEEMVNKYGPNLFYKSIELRQLCCRVRKVEPLNRILGNLDAWICGLRREQAVTRKNIKNIEPEERVINGRKRIIVKINPLAYWSTEKVWKYIRENTVPYNALHDKRYPSIGCVPCTRPVREGEDLRAGRWWWESPEKRECGLHRISETVDYSSSSWWKVDEFSREVTNGSG